MATLRLLYASAQALTVTGLATLANATSATSATLDNTSNLYMDLGFEVVVTTGTSATATGTVELYAKGSLDGADFDDDANDRWIGTLALAAAGAGTYKKVCMAASAFGGVLPPYVQLRVRNATGAPLAAGTAASLGILVQSA